MQHSVSVHGSPAHVMSAGAASIELSEPEQSKASSAVPSALVSAHVRGGATPAHTPAVQTSLSVLVSPSSHAVPSSTFVPGEHCPRFSRHAPVILQGESRQLGLVAQDGRARASPSTPLPSSRITWHCSDLVLDRFHCVFTPAGMEGRAQPRGDLHSAHGCPDGFGLFCPS